MSGEAFAFVRTFRVGSYTVTAFLPAGGPGVVAAALEWNPPRESVLTRAEMEDFYRGREEVVRELNRLVPSARASLIEPPRQYALGVH